MTADDFQAYSNKVAEERTKFEAWLKEQGLPTHTHDGKIYAGFDDERNISWVDINRMWKEWLAKAGK